MSNSESALWSNTRGLWRATGTALVALTLLGIYEAEVYAQDPAREIDNTQIRHPGRMPFSSSQPSAYPTSGADTIWVGYKPESRSPSNPYGIDIGGVWDFDSGISGTDSTQFWQFYLADWRSESTTALPEPEDRPIWYFDHGNEVNIGDTNLWLDRENRGMHAQNMGPSHTAGYLRTGITGYWHVDDMSGVSSPVSGLRSAWCGLRGPNDFTAVDEVSGNPLNGDLARYWTFGGALIKGSWPGYGNQIEQVLYHDITLANGDGSDVLSFRFRTDMSDRFASDNNGSAWFNPDPTTMDHFILEPVDSLMVWAGLPQDGNYYDVNKRWLSEVLNFDSTSQPVKLFAQHGKAPMAGTDSTVTANLPAWGSGTTVRVAFQVKTNRQHSDETYDLSEFDSMDGAALIDDVGLNGTAIGDFESPDAIKPRMSLPGGGTQIENDPSMYWITTAKPPAGYAHIHNLFDLPYNDPCGSLMSPDRNCNVSDNILVMSNHDDPDHAFFRESWVCAESPTIDLSASSPLTLAGVGDLDHDAFRLFFELWTGKLTLDVSVFWQDGVRYHSPNHKQQADEMVPGWSDNIVGPWINYFDGDGLCYGYNSHDGLDIFVPLPSELDSLKVFLWTQTRCARFGATSLCGKPQGLYFDNMRVGFTNADCGALSLSGASFTDAFPFNENISPGTADFDTATILVKGRGNRAGRDEGVIAPDTVTVHSKFSPRGDIETRLDLIFRILPGPGNYSVKGDRDSPLWKIPSDPGAGTASPGDGSFWGQYLMNPGPLGKGIHNGLIWDPTTWNSARMDSADNGNLSPVVSGNMGVPVLNRWHTTLHEEDPNYSTLGIQRNICFLVDPMGVANSLNVCCTAAQCAATPLFDTWPPMAYPLGTPTTTIEGTKILPDGIFTPGAHIEYFIRRSDAPEGLGGLCLSPDTTDFIFYYEGFPYGGGQRFSEFGALPDLWKDAQWGGDGLACMLVVDASNEEEALILGALDSLGFGKNTGAGRGWWEDDPSTTNPNANDPDNYVYRNLGQKGLAFDWLDNGGNNEIGSRLVVAPPDLAERQSKQGPTPEMVKLYYNTILYPTGCCSGLKTENVDALLDYLGTTGPGQERAVWIAGDDLAMILQNSSDSGPTLLHNYFAVVAEADDYIAASGNASVPSSVVGLIPEFSTPPAYGFWNWCQGMCDVISVNESVPDGELALRYEDASDGDPSIKPGTYGAAVYRPADNLSRYYTTLFTSVSPFWLRGAGFENSSTDFGRIAFFDNLTRGFGLCSSIGPVIAVGDNPGTNGRQLNFVRGAFPNPSTKRDATVQFDLARPSEVTIRFYNVAGRLVHEANLDGIAGPNVYKWDGSTSTGIHATSGVYFYRLSAPGVRFENNHQKLVILDK